MVLESLRNEPDWLKVYRERNAAIVKQDPLQKSKYANVPFFRQLISHTPASDAVSLPQLDPALSDCVSVFSWEEALQTIPALVKSALEQEFPARDQFEASVNAFFSTGFVVLVKKRPSTGLLEWKTVVPPNAVAKTLVVVQESVSDLALLETVSLQQACLSQSILVSDAASVALARSFEAKNALVAQQSVLGKDAVLDANNQWLRTDNVRVSLQSVLAGSGSVSNQNDWALLGQNERLDINLISVHQAVATQSHSVFKSVLEKNAYSVFDGMIKILPQGQQSKAFLEAYGLLLSRNASCNNIPGLEIEADDVKATHSASVAQLNEEELFYLRSRGLDEKTAKQLVVMGFLEALLHRLPESVVEKLSVLLESKWAAIKKQ